MSIVSRLSGGRFLVIGRAGLDLYPEPPGTAIEDAASYSTALGGSAGNIAAALTRQNCQAALVTCMSDDPVGRFTLNQLDAYGIDRTHVRSVGGEARNTLALSETRLDGHQTVIYRNAAADFEMSAEDVTAIDYSAYSALITAGTVFASEPSRSACFEALERAKDANLPIIFDVDYRPYSWASAEEAADVYARAGAASDLIVGNDVEFGFMAGDYGAGLDKARQLVADGASIAVYKMGEKGAITITPDAEFRTGVFPVEALKPVGAGDAFMGAFVSTLAAGRSLENAVTRGAASAAIVVGRVGCAPAMPTTEELDAFIAEHPGPTAV